MDKERLLAALKEAYKRQFGCAPDSVARISAGGSNRRYIRMSSAAASAIASIGTVKAENKAFLYMSRHLAAEGLNVPQIYYASRDGMSYLQQDLGDLSLAGALKRESASGRYGASAKALLADVVGTLPDIQYKGGRGMDWSVCYPSQCFDARMVEWDLSYFKYCFLKLTSFEIDEEALQDDFDALSRQLLSVPCDCFMYRDFQSRNVMVKDGEPWLIDFQGGRKGPFYYDVASFLWQAKANYPESLRQELLEEYLKGLRKYQPIDEKYFYAQLRHFVLFRTMQVLGAYGFRGYFEKKPHFIQSVPFAIENLRQLLKQPFTEYPYLCQVLNELTQLKQFTETEKHLTVRVMSFAYKKGIPDDPTGNGGGFVFDCRAINNPGKYDRYKPFIGLDEPVIKFLEDDGEILTFLEHVYALVDATVKRYIERKFTNLSICFGCTGGQHRSVYAAQHLAEHLNKKFGVEVNLIHREQNIQQQLNRKTIEN